MKIIDQYKNDIAYLESMGNIERTLRRPKKYDNPRFFLKRLKYFLDILGKPQKRIKRYIHIGGTSGKGSVSSFLHEIIVSSGKKSGVFTSPFLTETIEKYKINNRLITPKEFVDIMKTIKTAVDKCDKTSIYGAPSYFEICFAIAIIHFTKNKCDYVISEVGMGGEFDATNIVSKKILSIITHIDYDHMKELGNTLEKIATTKSKIISKKSQFITAEKRPKILKIFQNECKLQGTEFFKIRSNNAKTWYKNNKYFFTYKNTDYNIGNIGKHQVENAVLAMESAKLLGFNDNDIKKGIKNNRIAGRFEIISKNPHIVLDVAHNPDKMQATIDNIGLMEYNKLYIVYATASDKDYEKMAQSLSPIADCLYATRFFNNNRKCTNPQYIVKIWKKYNDKIGTSSFLDPWLALETAAKRCGKKDMILVTGSFFLVGELRKKWWPSEKIIRTRKLI